MSSGNGGGRKPAPSRDREELTQLTSNEPPSPEDAQKLADRTPSKCPEHEVPLLTLDGTAELGMRDLGEQYDRRIQQLWVCPRADCRHSGYLDGDIRDLRTACAVRRLAHGHGSRKDRRLVSRSFDRHVLKEHKRAVGRGVELDAEIEAKRVMPRWAAVHSFKPAVDYAISANKAIRREMEAGGPVGCAASIGALPLSGLLKAHVITVSPEQIRALPQWSLPEATEYASRLDLPFDPIYIDCTTSPGKDYKDMAVTRMLVQGGVVEASLGGALVSKSSDELIVQPFGSGVRDMGSVKTLVSEEDEGHDGWWVMTDPEHTRHPPPFATLGHYRTGRMLPEEEDIAIELGSGPIGDNYLVHTAWFGAHMLEDGARGAIMLGVPDAERLREQENWKGKLGGWAAVIAAQASAILGVLYLMDSDVELVQAPVSRPERRRAEREDARIPLAIAVRHKHRIAGPVSLNPEHRSVDWSHQWEVAGHYKHLASPGDRRVACTRCDGIGSFAHREGETCDKCHGSGLDPERVTPCVRRDHATGDLTCPHGCRRIWTPPHWKGPEDKPMVRKTRVVRMTDDDG